jgi:hypothetical protein
MANLTIEQWNRRPSTLKPATSDTQGIGKLVVGAGWYLPWHAINDLQRQSVDQLIKRSKAAHFTNVNVRINGKWEESEADWIKHMVRSPTPETRTGVSFHEGMRQSYLKAVEALVASGMSGDGDRSDLLQMYQRLWPQAPSDIRAPAQKASEYRDPPGSYRDATGELVLPCDPALNTPNGPER